MNLKLSDLIIDIIILWNGLISAVTGTWDSTTLAFDNFAFRKAKSTYWNTFNKSDMTAFVNIVFTKTKCFLLCIMSNILDWHEILCSVAYHCLPLPVLSIFFLSIIIVSSIKDMAVIQFIYFYIFTFMMNSLQILVIYKDLVKQNDWSWMLFFFCWVIY